MQAAQRQAVPTARADKPIAMSSTKPHRATIAPPRTDSSHPTFLQRAAMAAAACTLTASLLAGAPPPAAAEATSSAVEPVYFGNGCFWGRQYDYAMAEQKILGRAPTEVSALAGYAGGKSVSPSNKVCYYYTPDKNEVYERLGHAEVVQVELRAGTDSEKEAQFKAMADVYFKQFRRLPGGKMLRLDPQDAGPGYRNVIGIPGGVNGPLFKVLQAANVNGMDLREGAGGAWREDGRPAEDDLLNVVWVVDSDALPFHAAERYHQFHTGIGEKFPESYTKDLKAAVFGAGREPDTGCPEYFFLSS